MWHPAQLSFPTWAPSACRAGVHGRAWVEAKQRAAGCQGEIGHGSGGTVRTHGAILEAGAE